jgi:glycine cleavage system H protein
VRVNIPEELSYTEDHEWARVEPGRVTVGITDFAQAALGDVVFVELPAPGTRVARGDTLGEIESTKSVSEIYAPVAGLVASVNSALADKPEQLNEDPYGNGWLCVIEEVADADVAALLPAQRYRELTAS